MSAKLQREIVKRIVTKEYGPEEKVYVAAKRRFAKEKYVSVGMLQRYMQISYLRARYVLDRMIATGFCEEQDGARPCRIIRLVN